MAGFETKILKDENLTFSEKILSLKSVNKKAYTSGDTVIVKVDQSMAQDSTGPLSIKILKEMGIDKVWNSKKILLVIDHTFPAADIKVANLHNMMRDFSRKHNCKLIEGSISHQYLLENYVVPGMLLLGADSHTCQAGALSAFAAGIGSTEMAAVWATGSIWLRVPQTFKINVTGKLKKGVFARDIIMKFLGMVGEDGGTYKTLEWQGDTISKLSIDSRACICNNAIECGSKNSFMHFDSVAKKFLQKVKRKPLFIANSGKKANYADEFEIEADKLEPLVTYPGNADKVHSVDEAENVEIDEAFLGSTTNGRLEDLEIAAKMLKNKKVKQGTRLIITPASEKIYGEAIRRGYVDIFLKAGAVFTNSTCGACVGTHMGVLGDNEVCISCSPRNYIGRMGASSSKIYLGSPATVTASAIEGKITDPRKYLK